MEDRPQSPKSMYICILIYMFVIIRHKVTTLHATYPTNRVCFDIYKHKESLDPPYGITILN